MIYFLFLINFLFANSPDESIIVESHKNYEVYVAPIKIIKMSDAVESVISEKSVYGYSSNHWKNAKILRPNHKNIWDPITMHQIIKVYDEDTIEYAWDNCNYKRDAKKCSYQNNHMLQETYITIDDHQITVDMFLYGPDLIVINKSTYTSQSKIKWIKQQEVTVTQQQGVFGSQTTVNIPKEELPLKWLIPTNLMNDHIRNASMGLWTGAKIN